MPLTEQKGSGGGETRISGFLWTARRFENGIPTDERIFVSAEARDAFVARNPGWKKRGKICAGNLSRHVGTVWHADVYPCEEAH